MTPAAALRTLGWCRAALGLVFVVRTTPLANALPEPLAHMTTPLLGWPEHGFRAAWEGLEIPDGALMVLCVVRTAAAIAFALGAFTRAAGLVACAAAFAVLSQNAFAFTFTLYTLFVGTGLLSLGDAGSRFAIRPSRPRSPETSLAVIRVFVAAVYAWSGIAKLRGPWLRGETLRALYENHFLSGPLADALFGTPGRCLASACGVVGCELALAPLLLIRRTRFVGLVLALGMHGAYEWTAHPDVFGWVMAALLVSFLPPRTWRRRCVVDHS